MKNGIPYERVGKAGEETNIQPYVTYGLYSSPQRMLATTLKEYSYRSIQNNPETAV